MSHRLSIRRHHIMFLIPEVHITALEAPKDILDESDFLFRSSMMNDDLSSISSTSTSSSYALESHL